MWVPKNNRWNENATKLEKFFIEKIIQRSDYNGTISKKHRTINGFIQLKELIKLAELSKQRIQTLRTLVFIIKESKSSHIKQNIANDLIICRYFSDLRMYILNLDEEDLFKNDSLDKIEKFIHELKKHQIQLDKSYFSHLITEFTKIDFSEKIKVERYIKPLSDLIDLTIPYLLDRGYSLSSINEVLRRWIESSEHIDLQKFLTFFNKDEHQYEVVILLGKNERDNDELKKIIYQSGVGDIRKANEFKDDFINPTKFSPRDEVIHYKCIEKDPVSFIRQQYDDLIKNLVLSKDRLSLSIFTNFFKNSYWKKSNSIHKKFKNAIIDSDPISVVSRKSTLFSSLRENPSIEADYKSSLTFVQDNTLKKAIYYYNLALGSKSIENSLSLLWTSIECVLPYRIYKSDIENIKEIFSKTFSFGAISRDIQYLIKRILVVNKINGGCFASMGINELPINAFGENIIKWIEWLKKDHLNKFKEFDEISGLLAQEYLLTMKPLIEGNLSQLKNRIEASRHSISYQLQRIYLHRNQIVHSGDYINEYTNLWLHLEWYVGKFLYYSIIGAELLKPKQQIESLFRELESEYDYVFSYFEKNPNKKCFDSEKIINRIIKIDWQ
ncbi:hypothetical protein [Sphingobacterium zeae]|uniref:hypothetical protein n=1 Tax=Sphingobacterium zeae TaxID=1776859 RepID=UPI0036114AA9